MNLGIFLSPGESLNLMKKTGQDVRFIELYLKKYSKEFKKVYVFSYDDVEKTVLPENVILVGNKNRLPRLLYSMLLPFINKKAISDCDVIRGFGLASSLSGILTWKPFVFNWAFDYISFSKIEGKPYYVPLYFVLEKLAFMKAHKVFIATKKKMRKLNEDKFIYLPNGVDTNLFKPNLRNKLGILYVGRLEKQKNLFFLLDAIALLPKSFRKVTFLGFGSLKEKLQKYAREKNVQLTIHDPIPNSNLPNFFADYSIFTLTSFAEGSPKALLEAMAVGLVPIVTNFETAKDVVNNANNGYIINDNKEEFSAKIKNLLENKDLWLNLSKNASLKISTEFNMRTLINEEIRILKNAK